MTDRTPVLFRPYPFQREGAAFIERSRRRFAWNGHQVEGVRALLGDEMGLGKTPQSFLWLRRNPDERPTVVVSPAFVKESWRREASTHFGLRMEVLETTRPPVGGLGVGGGLLAVNYDILPYWVPWLRSLNPRTVVLDEAHYLKNPGSRRTRAATELCLPAEGPPVPNVIALTGTPVENRPRELYPILRILRPWEYEFPVLFYDRYCSGSLGFNDIQYNGASHLDELHDRLVGTGLFLRRTKAQVLPQLPPIREAVLPMGLADRGRYEEAERDLLAWLARERSLARADRAAKVAGMAQWTYLKHLAAQLKLPAVIQWADAFLESDQKLLLFAIHKDIIATLADHYAGRCVVIDGDVPPHKRLGLADRFNHHDRLRILIGNVQAAGVGISIKSASTAALAELWWNGAVHDQAVGRIHGLGRGVPGRRTLVYYLVADRTVESALCRMIDRKAGIVAQILDGRPARGGRPLSRLELFAALEAELRGSATHTAGGDTDRGERHAPIRPQAPRGGGSRPGRRPAGPG